MSERSRGRQRPRSVLDWLAKSINPMSRVPQLPQPDLIKSELPPHLAGLLLVYRPGRPGPLGERVQLSQSFIHKIPRP